MKNIFFTDPNGKKHLVTDIECLKNSIIDNFEEYWMQGSGDGFFDFCEDEKEISTLMVGPNIAYGLYLRFIDVTTSLNLLSLYDESRLSEVAETAEEIYTSVGLFLPLEAAWKGILDFVKTGKPSSKIKWITPEDMPEDGNW